MKVKDFMIRDVYKLKEEDTIQTLLETLSKYRIGGLPIVNDYNQLVGIVSDGDVLRYINPKTYSSYLMFYKEDLEEIIPEKIRVNMKTIMKKNVVTVYEDDELEKALNILSQHHFKKLPVLNKSNRVVGIVSRGDVIRKITEKVLNAI
ncbi:CBS domain-containing protein [Oceanobacillus piezotolerans]|uniref:CBS domain-containing protein n=1 Tax=Oceanobacillus piezotolerans TaxID=2448030 RepID=A0A498D5W6_9BACI|nr:CBS domain-containing protein [Oceanobacillus piezotolerans]RLL44846.1 CBS domain-containing protein [Oceanobacillus piezotolerans]